MDVRARRLLEELHPPRPSSTTATTKPIGGGNVDTGCRQSVPVAPLDAATEHDLLVVEIARASRVYRGGGF